MQLLHPDLDLRFGAGTLTANAKKYWVSPDEDELMETLVSSDLQIIRQLSEQDGRAK